MKKLLARMSKPFYLNCVYSSGYSGPFFSPDATEIYFKPYNSLAYFSVNLIKKIVFIAPEFTASQGYKSELKYILKWAKEENYAIHYS